MYVLVEERAHTTRATILRFKQEGLCLSHIEPSDFPEWINALQPIDIRIIEAFIVGETEHQLRFPKLIRRHSDAPILCLKEGNDLDRTVALFGAGADDVVHREIHPLEVVARSYAISRRVHKATADSIDVGELRVYLDGRRPEIAGKALELTRREKRILEYLARNRTRYVTRSQIFNTVYGLFDYHTDERAVESHICKLRKKLIEYLGFDPIQTRRYLGYMLVGTETRSASKASHARHSTRHLSIGAAGAQIA